MKRFQVANLAFLLILTLSIALLSGCGSGAAEDARSADGAQPGADQITVFDDWSEDASEMLSLATGAKLSNTAFTFAYNVSDSFSFVRVYYDVYRAGEPERTGQHLLLYRFASGAADLYRSGKLMLDLKNGCADIYDTYHKTADWAWPENTSVQTFGIHAMGSFPEGDELPFRSSFKTAYGKGTAAAPDESNIAAGEPVLLMFYGESSNDAVFPLVSGKTAEDILSDPALMGEFDTVYVFYCVFG